VTVCLAAACLWEDDIDKQAIVLCTDLKMSGPLGSAETALKQRTLGKAWYALTSGSEPEIEALISTLADRFKEAEIIDESNISKIISDSLLSRKRQKSTELVMGKFAMSYDDFVQIGKDKLPPDIFRDAVFQIADLKLPEFIIAGFDGNFSLICQTSSSANVSIREGFAVIGEGGYLATAALLQREQSSVSSIPETLYNVYEAKRYAEKVPSVGKRTRISVLSKGGLKVVTAPGRRWLRERYKEFGPQEINYEGLKMQDDFLCDD
jgi:20S proteasome alpha/beta subunit